MPVHGSRAPGQRAYPSSGAGGRLQTDPFVPSSPRLSVVARTAPVRSPTATARARFRRRSSPSPSTRRVTSARSSRSSSPALRCKSSRTYSLSRALVLRPGGNDHRYRKNRRDEDFSPRLRLLGTVWFTGWLERQNNFRSLTDRSPPGRQGQGRLGKRNEKGSALVRLAGWLAGIASRSAGAPDLARAHTSSLPLPASRVDA